MAPWNNSAAVMPAAPTASEIDVFGGDSYFTNDDEQQQLPPAPINNEVRRRRTQSNLSWALLYLFTLIIILLIVPTNLTFFVLFVSMALLTCWRVLERQRQEPAKEAAATTTETQ